MNAPPSEDTNTADGRTPSGPQDDAPRAGARPDEAADSGYGLTDTDIAEISEVLNSGHEDAVVAQLSELGPADTAELISKISEEDREKLLREHIETLDPYTFIELPAELRREILEDMPSVQVAALLSEMDSDDALDLLTDLDEEFQQTVIRKLSARMRMTMEEGLNYPEESAGRLMQREFVAIPQFWTVGKTIDYMRAAADEIPDEFFDIFVITPTYKVAGGIPLSRLIRARRSEKLQDLVLDDTYPIPATLDQEEVAQIFRREDLTSAPVIDQSERLIGVITIDDVVDVIDEEGEEDILRLGGVEQGDFYRAILSTTGSRFRWLFVNLVTAILASIVISFFDATIQQVVALAILMPIVASMGGNAGTQSFTVVVRALATRQLSETNAWRIVWKETVVGTLNGLIFACICGAVAGLWFKSPMLGLIMGMALIVNLFCAGLSGAAIPLVLKRLGSDPAISSAVFLTTVTDVIGFFAFLGLAAIFLT